jgi:hypothetical protein
VNVSGQFGWIEAATDLPLFHTLACLLARGRYMTRDENTDRYRQHLVNALIEQCHFPHLRLRRQYAIGTHVLTLYLIDPEQQTTVVIQQQDGDAWHITVYGTYPLWSQVYESYQQWKQANQPKRDQYRLHLTPQGLCTLSY